MNNTFSKYRPPYSGQDIDPFYFPKYRPPYFWTRYRSFLLLQNIDLHTSGQDIDPFYFPKYRPPYFWTRYRSFLLLRNISLHNSGQDMTYSSEVHDKGDPFSKLLE